MKLEKIPSLKRLSGEIKKLAETETGLKKSLSTTKADKKPLDTVLYNVQKLLGYRELELQDLHPIATLQGGLNIVDIPVCKSTFAQAKSAGVMEQYFQSEHLNHDCAEVIRNTMSANLKATQSKQDDIQLAYSFIRRYGVGRVSYVLDTPLVNVKDEDLSFAVYKLRQAVKLASAEIIWDRGEAHKLSHEDKMAVAQKKADEHNRSREIVKSKTQAKANFDPTL